MKKFLIVSLAAFAMANAVFAQTEQQPSAADAKAAAKAKKAQDAADLKAFKAKQAQELAAFIEAQKKGPQPMKLEKPALVTDGDSIAYLFGVAQSNGLEGYATGQLGVEKNMLNKFGEGILSRVSVDPNDQETKAFNAGMEIGDRVATMAKSFSDDYYAADKDKSIDVKIVANGLVAGLLGISDIPVDSASTTFQQTMKERQAANKERLYGPNREAGQKFLAENKTKPGVVTTASGLQYKVITAGTGAKPTASQKVTVDYEGKLIDGTVFDSSYQRGKPATFGVTQVISGWTEALQLMTVGSKWELYIPYELAYGERETGDKIKPYSALVFTVELKGIE